MKPLVEIDGSNFFHKVKRLAPRIHLTNYRYDSLLAHIVSPQKNYTATYYIGEIKNERHDEKNQQLFANQQKLFHTLRTQHVGIKLGFLLKSDGIYHEKGVDVQIAADMIYGALKNLYSTFYLLSSDTDLLPAIAIAKNEKKKVVYVGFDHAVSQALLHACSSHIILTKTIIEAYQ